MSPYRELPGLSYIRSSHYNTGFSSYAGLRPVHDAPTVRRDGYPQKDIMRVRHFQRFCDLVRAIRHEHRLSQRALAKVLQVSPGYVGQWELRLSQPSEEVAVKLCRTFAIEDAEYVQRLAYASRAPEWLKESIIQAKAQTESGLNIQERRLLRAVRGLPAEHLERLVDKVEGWAEAMSDTLGNTTSPR